MMMEEATETLRRLATTHPVVVFASSGCCMCHVVKHLLFGLGVAPTVLDLDLDGDHPKSSSSSAAVVESHRDEIRDVLFRLAGGGRQSLPAVFVGGKYLGGIEAVMACHINGTLVPLLKEAGALWL